MTAIKKKSHGGARTGAGRTRKEKDLRKRRNLSLSDATIKKANKIGKKETGKNNASEGIAKAIKDYKL